MTTTITREHLTIEHGTARWGGPTATVTVTTGPLEGRTFWLRSTQGLDPDEANDLAKGGGIHLDATNPEASLHGWMGAFKTYDMDEAIDGLVDTVNDLAVRRQVREATWQQCSAVESALEALNFALEEVTPRDWRQEWQRVQEAVAALDMKIQEVAPVTNHPVVSVDGWVCDTCGRPVNGQTAADGTPVIDGDSVRHIDQGEGI